jgi:signal transduction histidine kinase
MFWMADKSRTLMEALVIALLLALLLRLEVNASLAVFAFLWIGLVPGIYVAFRAHLPEGLVDVLPELLFAIALNLLLQGVVLLVLGANVLSQVWNASPLAYLGSLLVLILVFILLRAGMVLSCRWQQLRRRRMALGIVHAQLLTLLTIIGVLAAREGITTLFSSGMAWVPPEQWLAAALTLLMPGVFSIVIATPFAAFFLLLGGGIAYLISRPITQRIENLATVTEQLTGGDYSARVTVIGLDEVAQLQADFNTMAATLENTMNALRNERNTVANLLQSRREWLTTISHELRTPVATMRGYLEATKPDDFQREREVITREVLHLQNLLEDLFALARSDSGHLTIKCVEMDIRPLMDHIVQTFAGLARQKAAISVVNTSSATTIIAVVDPTRLEQILYNLLHNSLRHTPPGGIIALGAEVKDQQVHITVEDTGEGIPADILEHIWEKFYSTDNRPDNAGIGLALVKELVMSMRGKVSVSSIVGQGTRFSICLPLTF